MALIKEVRNCKPQIAENVYLAETATIIGDVQIGEGSSIWFGAVLRGDVSSITLGKNVNIQDNAVLHGSFDHKDNVLLKDGASVGHAAIVHGAIICEDALVGMGATVLDGAVVGRASIVAANSLVLAGTVIGEYELWAGVPAKFIKKVSAEQAKGINENISKGYMKYSKWYK